MKTAIACLAALLLCACSTSDTSSATTAEGVNAVLATTLTDADYGQTKRCLPRTSYHRIQVLDEQHLLFWGRGQRVWLNRLATRCKGLNDDLSLELATQGSQACRLSMLTAGIYGAGPRARCAIGSFQEIPQQQAKVLAVQFKQQR